MKIKKIGLNTYELKIGNLVFFITIIVCLIRLSLGV
jgi:hypothetical protein